MASIAQQSHPIPNRKVAEAVHRHGQMTKQGLLERAFTFAFRGLVYAQIWEDPEVDMAAMAIEPGNHIVTIASGGCNVLSYLTADPARITAVDLNTAHIALNRLKLTAAQHLPDHASFHRFFGQADQAENPAAYREFIRPHLDETSRRYWKAAISSAPPHRRFRPATFIAAGCSAGSSARRISSPRFHGVDPRAMLAANSIEEQREIFETGLAPIFDKKFVRWLTDQPASLFGLGIPPAQYDALAGEDEAGMAAVLRARLEKLACDFDIRDNYFAWQAFGRGYGPAPHAPLPPYLQEDNYTAVVDRVGRSICGTPIWPTS